MVSGIMLVSSPKLGLEHILKYLNKRGSRYRVIGINKLHLYIRYKARATRIFETR